MPLNVPETERVQIFFFRQFSSDVSKRSILSSSIGNNIRKKGITSWFIAEVTYGESVFRKHLACRTIAIDWFYGRWNRCSSPGAEECIGGSCWKIVTPVCRTGSTILFTDFQILCSVIHSLGSTHCFHVIIHYRVIYCGSNNTLLQILSTVRCIFNN